MVRCIYFRFPLNLRVRSHPLRPLALIVGPMCEFEDVQFQCALDEDGVGFYTSLNGSGKLLFINYCSRFVNY